MEPTRGIHENVFVCDYKSMYPTITASCNINPHSFSSVERGAGEKDGRVTVEGYVTETCLEGKVVTFDNERLSVMSSFMRYLVEERDRYKSSLPMYPKSLKVLSNSVYGSLGYCNSRLYSPTCAASVTAVGRHCVNLSRRFFLKEGLTVVYGDTNSCMVTGEGPCDSIRERVGRALGKLYADMRSGPLSMMRMEV